MANVYQIGVAISLSGNILQGLQAISKHLLGIHTQVGQVQGGFSRWALAVGGVGAIAGGVSILEGLKKVTEHNDKLLHQQNALYRATQNWQGVVALTGTAYDKITKAVPTATASDVLRSVNELRSVTGSMESATAISPMSLKMEAILNNLTGKDAEGEGFKLWRALEMKGITVSDPAMASKLALQMVQNIAGSGGKIDASTYQDLAKRGGAAWIGATPDAINRYSVAAADLGGATAGTAIMTLDQLRTGATTLSRQQLQVLEESGLINMSKVHKIPGSNAMNIEPGAMFKGSEDQGNLYQWAQDIAPKLHEFAGKLAQKNGVTEGQAFDSIIAKLGRNRNAIRMLHMFMDPGFMEQATKDIDIWSKNMGLDQAYSTMLGMPTMVTGKNGRVSEAASSAAALNKDGRLGDYTAVMAAFNKQWESLLEAVGGPVASAAIPLMRTITDIFNSLGSMANAHPEAIQAAAKGLAVLGVAMIALGTGAVLAAAIALTGPIGAAILVVSSAMTALAAINWGAISSGLDRVRAAIASLFGAGGDASPTGRPMHPDSRLNSLVPPVSDRHASNDQPIHIKTAIYLDGRAIGENTSMHLARASTFPTQAAYGDSYLGWNAPDNNFATG